MSTQVTISKKTIRKIAAAIAAVNNSREVGGLFMGYRHSSKYRIVDATVPDCEKCSGVASFVLDGAEETAKAEKQSNLRKLMIWEIDPAGEAKICRAACETENIP